MASEQTNDFVIKSWGKDATASILTALAAVDDKDLDYLLTKLGDGGRDRFWKAVVADLRAGLNAAI